MVETLVPNLTWLKLWCTIWHGWNSGTQPGMIETLVPNLAWLKLWYPTWHGWNSGTQPGMVETGTQPGMVETLVPNLYNSFKVASGVAWLVGVSFCFDCILYSNSSMSASIAIIKQHEMSATGRTCIPSCYWTLFPNTLTESSSMNPLHLNYLTIS